MASWIGRHSITVLSLASVWPGGLAMAEETRTSSGGAAGAPDAVSVPVAEAEAVSLFEPSGRQGYYLGGGFRLGAFGGRADDVGSLGFLFANGGAFRLGQMATDVLGFGLVAGGGGQGNDHWRGGFGMLGLELLLSPLPGEDLGLRGGVGVAGFGFNAVDPDEFGDESEQGSLSPVYSLGVSYDLFPFRDEVSLESGGFSFTGVFELLLLPGDGVWTGGASLALEFTYWFGFPKSRLVLPDDAAYADD